MDASTSELVVRPREQVGFAVTAVIACGAAGMLIAVTVLFRSAVVEAFEMEGHSASPTIFESERFAVNKGPYGLFMSLWTPGAPGAGTPELGEVVLFKNPADGVTVVKRVIGLPGDVIETRDLTVVRNQQTLARADAACPTAMPPAGASRRCYRETLGSRRYLVAYDGQAKESAPVRVPRDRFFVLGDYRTRSADSRDPAVGLVARKSLLGAATRIYWSPHRGRFLELVE
jgi:signal peptidase I